MVTRAGCWRAVVATVAGAAVLGVPGVAPGGRAVPGQAPCASPYLPVFGAVQQGGPMGPATQVWPAQPARAPSLDGTDRSYLEAVRDAGVDTDGDGTADQISVEGNELVITRGDGAIRLGTTGDSIGEASSHPVGDLDADGHDEVYFLTRPAGSGDDVSYLLPGATAPGSYQSADAAIRVPGGIRFPVGQQVDGPGSDLLAAVGPDGAIVSGDALMAPGPGGSLAAFVAASPPFPGQPIAVLDLDGAAPTIVTIEDATDHDDFVLWQQGETTRYRTAGTAAHLDPSASPFLQAIDNADGRILVGGAGDRAGTTQFFWDFDDPCRTAQPLPTPTEPVAADALPGRADYTG